MDDERNFDYDELNHRRIYLHLNNKYKEIDMDPLITKVPHTLKTLKNVLCTGPMKSLVTYLNV